MKLTHHLRKLILCIATLCTTLFSQAIADTELYVARNGNDSNRGTLEKPFATINRARNEVRKIKASSRGDIIVNIRGGTYYLTESILLDHRDSGVGDHYVIYRNYAAEAPILIGGTPVIDWKNHQNGIMKAYVGKDVEFWSLLVNNKLAPIASEKNWKKHMPFPMRNVQAYYQGSWMSEYLKVKSVDNKNNIATAFQKSKFSGGLRQLQGAVAFIDKPGEWALDSDSGYLYYLPTKPSDLTNIIRPTVKSIFAFKGHRPDRPVQNIRIEGLELLLTDFNATMRCYGGITENGYEYHNCDQPNTLRTALVSFENARNNEILKCNMHDAPLNAVSMYGYAQNNKVSGSRMDNLGYSGVYLAGLPVHKDRTEIISKGNTVSNNLISNIMRAVNHATGIQIYQSADNIIEHNLIHTSRRYGISVKGVRHRVFKTVGLKDVPFEKYCDYVHSSRNIIRRNYMYNLGADSADGGGVECWGGGRDNVIDQNIIADAYCGGPKGGWRGHSIFLDDGSNYWTVKNNIVWNTRVPTVNACNNLKGVDVKTFNNVFDASLCDHGAANLEWYVEESKNHDFSRNILYSNDNRKTHRDGKLGPETDPTRKTFRLKGIKMIGSMDYNVYFNKQGKFVFSENKDKHIRTLEQWRAATREQGSFDKNSSLADPQFVNAEERDYRLKETSPALDMGIESIDTSKIGLLKTFSFAPKNDPLKRVFLKAHQKDVYVELPVNKKVELKITGRTEKWFVANLSTGKVSYSVDKPKLASVSADGIVSLKGKGRLVVTAKVSLNGVIKTDDVVIYSGIKRNN